LGQYNIIIFLSNIAFVSNSIHQYGNTALMLASERGHTATVQALLEAGADPNLQNMVSGAYVMGVLFCT
jgi:ankyrin repeat protein